MSSITWIMLGYMLGVRSSHFDLLPHLASLKVLRFHQKKNPPPLERPTITQPLSLFTRRAGI